MDDAQNKGHLKRGKSSEERKTLPQWVADNKWVGPRETMETVTLTEKGQKKNPA